MSQFVSQDPGAREHDLGFAKGDVKDGFTARPSRSDDGAADNMLESLGYKPELSRNRSTLQVTFMACVMGTIPYGLTTVLSYPIIGGGPVDIIWGWLAVSLIMICVAIALGEITSVYPTAGGNCLISLCSLCQFPVYLSSGALHKKLITHRLFVMHHTHPYCRPF